MFRFLHAADLHLGAPFQGVRAASGAAISETLKNATYDAFARMIDLAIERRVAFVVIAGDVYNAQDGNLGARLAFQRGVHRLHDSGIAAYLVHGNHDPLTGEGLRLPESCHTFPAAPGRAVVAHADGEAVASLYGVSFGRAAERDNLASAYPQATAAEADLFRIALLHGNVGGREGHDNYAPATLADLTQRGYDYWALGHIHGHLILRGGDPWVVYPGALQGLSPRETGAHGCVIVSVETRRRAQIEFVPTDVLRWHAATLDIADLADEDALLEAAGARLEELRAASEGRASLVRLTLVGRGPLHARLDAGAREELAAELRRRHGEDATPCWLESLAAATEPEIDLEALRQSPECAGTLLRLAHRIESEREQLDAAREALQPPFTTPGGRRGPRQLEALSDDELIDLLRAAAINAVDLLHREAAS